MAKVASVQSAQDYQMGAGVNSSRVVNTIGVTAGYLSKGTAFSLRIPLRALTTIDDTFSVSVPIITETITDENRAYFEAPISEMSVPGA